MPAPDPTRPLRAAFLAAVDAAAAAKAAAAAAYAAARAGIPAVAGLADAADAADAAAEAARRAWLASDEPRSYRLRDDTGGDWTVEATPKTVAAAAKDTIIETSDPDPDCTTWWHVAVSIVGGDVDGADLPVDELRVQIDAEEPDCEIGEVHDWVAPFWLVGGLKENPGVVGKGGGVVSTAACRNCGCQRIIDTWAQDPYDGAQGLTARTYSPGLYVNDFWERGVDAAARGVVIAPADLATRGALFREGYLSRPNADDADDVEDGDDDDDEDDGTDDAA